MLNGYMLKILFPLVFLLLNAGLAQTPAAAPPPLPARNILVINSYHPSYQWTQNEIKGYESILSQTGGRYNFFLEYMDTKRFSAGYQLNRRFKNYLVQKYKDVSIAAIFLTDDNALDFATDFHGEIFPGVPMVACGINRAEDELPPGHQNISIVHEKNDFAKTIVLILTLLPETENIVLLGDGTKTSRMNRTEAEKALEKFPSLRLVSLDGSGMTFREILQVLLQLKDPSVCLFLGFWQDRSGSFFSAKDIMPAVYPHLPVFVCSDAYLTPMALGGYVSSGLKQGEAAGRLTTRIMAGEEPGNPPAEEKLASFIINYPLLQKYGIDPGLVPEGTTLLNKPEDFLLKRYAYDLFIYTFVAVLLGLLLLVTNRDLFKRTAVVKKLQAAQRDLGATFESINDGLIVTDSNGIIQRLNSTAARLTGWPPEEATGYDLPAVYQAVDLETRRATSQKFKDLLEQIKPGAPPKKRIISSRDGQEHVIAESGSVIHAGNGSVSGIVLIFRDISEEIQILEDRRHAQKMEAIGKLAGGIAHDFNNLLTSIIGNAELLKMTLEENQEATECAEHIIKSSSRAADLTGQLLTFSRKGQTQLQPVNVHEVIHEVINLLGHSIDRRIDVVCNLDAYLHWTMGNVTQLQNALLNLGINARDAMPEGGTLTFTSHDLNIGDDHPQVVSGEMKPGKYLEISVADTGSGIEQRLRKRIFEPFFTTKPEGKGTGLGLAVVYGIVRTHHGTISLKSHPGRGTTFTILLPVCRAPNTKIPTGRESSFRPIKKGHILVVDDEDAIRSLLSKMLKQLGYVVSVCSDGLEAVQFYSRQGADVDVVIMDLMMPRMGGAEAFTRIRIIDPEAKILIVSGYTKSTVVEELLEHGAVGFISKPFHLKNICDELQKHVRI